MEGREWKRKAKEGVNGVGRREQREGRGEKRGHFQIIVCLFSVLEMKPRITKSVNVNIQFEQNLQPQSISNILWTSDQN